MPRRNGASIASRSLAQIQEGGKGELAGIHNASKPQPARPCMPTGPSYIGCQKTCAFYTPYKQDPMPGCVWFVDKQRKLGEEPAEQERAS